MSNSEAKHDLGQYFTTNEQLKKKVLDFVLNDPEIILEPSIGQGDLVEYILNNNANIQFDMYEIDTTIKMLKGVPTTKVIYGDFMKQKIKKKYKTIIGNPPFVRTKTGNLYIDFVEKCFNLLEDGGELVFIVPSDFLKLTCASKLLNAMIEVGTFTHIYHPNNENLFKHASIDVIVFRYCRCIVKEQKTMYNNREKYLINTNGIITFSNKAADNNLLISEYFTVYVGMVTGKESVYKNNTFGNITLLNKKNVRDKYIFIDTYPTTKADLDSYLESHKEVLINRKIKKFTEETWWQWGAPRNQRNIENNLGKKCIYISNLTRNEEVAFLGKVEYFGGSLLMMIPKKKIDLKKMVTYLNSSEFKSNYMFSGRFKIGHKQVCNALIPTK